MLMLSPESKRYFAPVRGSESAILSIDYSEELNKFVWQVFEEKRVIRENETLIELKPPKAWEAASFHRRFLHGCRERQSSYYTIPEFVSPVNRLSYGLFTQAWKGEIRPTPLAKLAMQRLAAREIMSELYVDKVARFKTDLSELNAKQPPLINGARVAAEQKLYPVPSDSWLKPYQQVAADVAVKSKFYNLHFEQGCGKTPTTIWVLDQIAKQTRKEHNRAAIFLITMPKSLTTNWEAEYRRFSKLNNRITIIEGNEHQRTLQAIRGFYQADNPDACVLLAGYDAAIGTPMLKMAQYDAHVVDEGHGLANPSTDRTKWHLELRKNSLRRYILTGTPIRNTPFDLYAQLEFLEEGLSQFSSHSAFKDFFGRWTTSYTGRRALDSFANIPILQEVLAMNGFRITKSEALPSLPERSFGKRYVKMTEEQARIYREVCDLLHAEFELIDSTDKVSVNNHLTKMLRLAQITSGYVPMDEQGIYRFDPNPKLEMLVEILSDLEEDSKALVWCVYHENIKQVRARLELEGIKCVTFYGGTNKIDRNNAVDSFNKDKSVKVFIGQPGAGGVGLNLLGYDPLRPDDYNTNADQSIYYGLDWNSVHRWQSLDRNHRIGTRVPVSVTDILVPNTIDTVIYSRVQEKDEIATSTQDLKEILKACKI